MAKRPKASWGIRPQRPFEERTYENHVRGCACGAFLLVHVSRRGLRMERRLQLDELQILGSGDNIDCQSAWFPAPAGMSAGAADILSVTNNDRTTFFTMVERRITGQPHVFMQYRGLRENFNAMFKQEGVKDWKELGKNAGFEVAEFSRDISGAGFALHRRAALYQSNVYRLQAPAGRRGVHGRRSPAGLPNPPTHGWRLISTLIPVAQDHRIYGNSSGRRQRLYPWFVEPSLEKLRANREKPA